MHDSMVFKPRNKATYKYNYGTVGFVSGSQSMAGACVLNVQACYRSGAGLVKAFVPEAIYTIVESSSLETITIPFHDFDVQTLQTEIIDFCDVIASGSGSANNPFYPTLHDYLLKYFKKTLILDAQGINLLKPAQLENHIQPLILTPHMGEMSRLIGHELGDGALNIASEFSKKYNLYLVLKSHETIISNPAGSVKRLKVGNPGMATAGTGDVLCGVIAGLSAQHDNLFEAIETAVTVCGLAGDLATERVGEYSLIASDLIEELPNAIKQLSL